jgi:hypothetical protein
MCALACVRERVTCLTLCHIPDIPDSRSDHDVNRCDPNLSFSRGLFLEGYRFVRHRSIPFIILCSCGRCCRSASVRHNLPPSGFTTSKTNRIPVPSDPPEPMELAVHCTYEQYQTPQTTSSQYASFMSGEGALPDKLPRLGDEEESGRGRTRVP